jgi:hypothetical protein
MRLLVLLLVLWRGFFSSAYASHYNWKVTLGPNHVMESIGDGEQAFTLSGGWKCTVGLAKYYPESKGEQEERSFSCTKTGAMVKHSVFCKHPKGPLDYGHSSVTFALEDGSLASTFVLMCD